MVVVAAIGIFTAILAASITFTQTDIKRVLAYSTLSQLGYMFAALGVGAFIAAIFHLMTHGFFKGLLFLGSGSVIHAVHEEQDMNRMGGLWRKIPITHWTMLIGAIAIAGIPPFAGFFSKDEILGDAYKSRRLLGLDHRPDRGCHDGVLHVAADGQDVLRAVARRPGGGAQDPRVAVADDAAAGAAGHPVRDPGHRAHLGRPAAQPRRHRAPRGLAGADLRGVPGVPRARRPAGSRSPGSTAR